MALVFLTLMGLSAAGVLYSYVGYPLLVGLLARMRRRPSPPPLEGHPTVSLLVAAYNEERVIAEKIENALALDWPHDRLEIVIASDGSTDRTNQIVESHADRGVRLIAITPNQGKMNALNTCVPQCVGEIIVMSDANSLYAPDAIHWLVAGLADPTVGAVCGELRYRNPDGSASGESEGLYWKYEKAIKRAESRFNTLIGANGSIYAIRKADYVPPPRELMDDLTIPLLIATRHGKRTIYEPRAITTEEPGDNFQKEYRRKIRIITRGFFSLMRTAREWLCRPALAFQVVSHKILRWFVPYFMLLFLAANAAYLVVAGLQAWAIALLGAQVVFYLVALVGHLRSRHARVGKLLGIITYFCVVNFASLQGIYNYFAGKRYVTWKTIREGDA
ncbi:MAG: glycosyltransferase family 2 protein [Candidatus Sumerlaeia bacterium]|nr:glycosyltransferase family 2 protein [Candidatus Sumerlaeia bacterium]